MGKVKDWRIKRKEEREVATPGDVIESVRKVAIAGLAVAMVQGFIGFAVWQIDKNGDERAEDQRVAREQQAASELLGRQIGSCRSFNENQTLLRNVERIRIQGLTVLIGGTEEEAQEVVASDEAAVYFALIDANLPFRQCSPDCVQRQSASGADKCAPASNEDGDP